MAHILIIDDDAAILDMLQQTLTKPIERKELLKTISELLE